MFEKFSCLIYLNIGSLWNEMIVQYYYFFLTVCRCGQPSNQVFFGVFCNLEESQLLIDINAWASSVPTYLQ